MRAKARRCRVPSSRRVGFRSCNDASTKYGNFGQGERDKWTEADDSLLAAPGAIGARWSRRQRQRGRPARRFALLESRPAWQAKIARALGSNEEPALRVWAAVLDDAIAALRGRHPLSRTCGRGHPGDAGYHSPEDLWREAVAWLLARDPEPLGTFESICLLLELPVAEVRRDLCGLAVRHAPFPAGTLIVGELAEAVVA